MFAPAFRRVFAENHRLGRGKVVESVRRHLCIAMHVQMGVRVRQGLQDRMQVQVQDLGREGDVRHHGRRGQVSMSNRLVKVAFVCVFWRYVRRGVFENLALGRDLILTNVFVSVCV